MGSIRVIPDYFSSDLIVGIVGAAYRCPLCRCQTITSDADIGWVHCPILDGYLCLGCYMDIALICNSEEYLEHPFVDTLREFAVLVARDIGAVRRWFIEFQIAELLKQAGRIRYEYRDLVMKEFLEGLL